MKKGLIANENTEIIETNEDLLDVLKEAKAHLEVQSGLF